MKRFTILALVLGMLGTFVPGAAQAKTLAYSSFFPPTHDQSKLAEEWGNEVERRTNGKVKVNFFPGGTLTSAKECYDGVVQGISDIGFSVLGYSRGRFPVMAAVDLPLGYRSGQAATQVANAVFEQFQPKEFNDVQVMYFHAHGPGLLHTAKKPVRTMDDLKGLKIRATGNSGLLVSALGGTPVTMSMPDSYQAIQRGVVNGGMYPLETNKGWKMAEVVDYLTESYSVAYTTVFFVVMNKDRWNSLDSESQQAIAEINREWVGKHATAWDESDIDGRRYFLERGGEVISLDEAESARWKEAARPMLNDYVQQADSKGLPGQKILDFIISTLTDTQQ
ncbi:MAG: TRAP transporter substrate-binding protein [Desulfovibrionales bacterium]